MTCTSCSKKKNNRDLRTVAESLIITVKFKEIQIIQFWFLIVL